MPQSLRSDLVSFSAGNSQNWAGNELIVEENHVGCSSLPRPLTLTSPTKLRRISIYYAGLTLTSNKTGFYKLIREVKQYDPGKDHSSRKAVTNRKAINCWNWAVPRSCEH